MTSNAGSHIIQKNFEDASLYNKPVDYDKTRKEVFTLLKTTLKPEFFNRIDEIIMFKPLTKEEISEIVRLQFLDLQKMLDKNQIKIEASDEAIEFIANAGFDPQFGARPVKRVIQKNILNELSKMILASKVSKDSTISIILKDNELQFVN